MAAAVVVGAGPAVTEEPVVAPGAVVDVELVGEETTLCGDDPQAPASITSATPDAIRRDRESNRSVDGGATLGELGP